MLKPNIQLFAESTEEPNAGNGGNPAQDGGNSPKTFTQADVDKIVNERTERAAKAAMKSFFQQKGLSEDEAAQAIQAYLAEKEKNNPETLNTELQTQLKAAQDSLLKERLTRAAEKAARKLGANDDSAEYVVRLADLSAAVDNGEISAEKVTEAVKKVLDDVPAFKKQNTGSGVKIGGDNEGDGTPKTTEPKPVPKHRWNRFNM